MKDETIIALEESDKQLNYNWHRIFLNMTKKLFNNIKNVKWKTVKHICNKYDKALYYYKKLFKK